MDRTSPLAIPSLWIPRRGSTKKASRNTTRNSFLMDSHILTHQTELGARVSQFLPYGFIGVPRDRPLERLHLAIPSLWIPVVEGWVIILDIIARNSFLMDSPAGETVERDIVIASQFLPYGFKSVSVQYSPVGRLARNSFLMDSAGSCATVSSPTFTRNSFLMDSDNLYTPGFI